MLPAPSKVWVQDGWTVNVSGVELQGRGEQEGEFLRIERPTKMFGYKGSGSGEGAFFRINGSLVQLTIVVPQTHSDNNKLMGIYAAQLLTNAPVPLAVQDGNGVSQLFAEAAMIESEPDEAVATEPGTLEWVLLVHAPPGSRLVGGH